MSRCVDCGRPMHPADARQSLVCVPCLRKAPSAQHQHLLVRQGFDGSPISILPTPGMILQQLAARQRFRQVP